MMPDKGAPVAIASGYPNFVAHRAYGSVNFSFFKPKEA